MRRRIRLMFLPLLAITGPSHAAEPCPTPDMQMDTIVAAIDAAPTCRQAAAVMNACLYGASGDTQFAAAVIEKCEKDFLPSLKPAASRAYKADRATCARRYAHRNGTMYISMEATCEAEVAVKLSTRVKR